MTAIQFVLALAAMVIIRNVLGKASKAFLNSRFDGKYRLTDVYNWAIAFSVVLLLLCVTNA